VDMGVTSAPPIQDQELLIGPRVPEFSQDVQ